MDHESMEEHEYHEVDSSGNERDVEEDWAEHRRNQIYRINGIIWFVFAVIEASSA